MNRGPQQQRLREYLDPENRPTLRTAAAQWRQGQDLLVDVSMQLLSMADNMATSSEVEFQGRAADATRASFHRSAKAMSDKAHQMRLGAQAFDDSASALDEAVADRDALAANDGARLPTKPSTTPGSTDPADVRAQRDYDTAVSAYWDRYQADEQRASATMAKLDERHTEAGLVFKSIHGEREPEVPPPWPPPDEDTTTGEGTSGTGTHGGTSTHDSVFVPTTHHDPYDNDGRPQTDGDVVTTDPGTGGETDPVPGDPSGPTGPTGPGGSTTTGPSGTSGGTATTGPAAGGGGSATGGAVAAGLGVGVVGGVTGGLTGGLALPGGATGVGGSAGGGRGIGGTGVRGAGSSVLGRSSSGMAGVGNGTGAGARSAGRGSGPTAGAGARGQGRGSAGSRGAIGGSGSASGRGRDKRRQAADHELFDDGTDWLDDDGAFDGLID